MASSVLPLSNFKIPEIYVKVMVKYLYGCILWLLKLPDPFENTESEDDDDDDQPGAADEVSDGNTLTETENAL